MPEDLYNEVKLLSMSGKVSFSELLREGLKTVIKNKNKINKNGLAKWSNFIGVCKTDLGGKSGQELINDYYKSDVV